MTETSKVRTLDPKDYQKELDELRKQSDHDAEERAKRSADQAKHDAKQFEEMQASYHRHLELAISKEREAEILADQETERKAMELAKKYNLQPAKLSFGKRGHARGAVELNFDKQIWNRVYDKNHLLKVNKPGPRR